MIPVGRESSIKISGFSSKPSTNSSKLFYFTSQEHTFGDNPVTIILFEFIIILYIAVFNTALMIHNKFALLVSKIIMAPVIYI